MNKMLSVLIIALVLSACNDSVSKSVDFTEQQDIVLKDTITSYQPVEATSRRTGTTLFDSLSVSIVINKSETDFISHIDELKDTCYLTLIRKTFAVVSITRPDTTFQHTIRRGDFPQIGDSIFVERGDIMGCWFEQFNSETQELEFWTSVCVIDTDYCYRFRIFISLDGAIRSELIEIT
jgi:hypothetical protein